LKFENQQKEFKSSKILNFIQSSSFLRKAFKAHYSCQKFLKLIIFAKSFQSSSFLAEVFQTHNFCEKLSKLIIIARSFQKS
jgi:hypothetical protein